MPNHVSNLLTIDGDRQRVIAAYESIKSTADESGLIDFEKIIPMPPEIFRGNPLTNNQGEIIGYGTSAADEEKYGAENCAINWSRKHWGTKWNSYDNCLRGNSIYFETAWSAPLPVIEALSARFPDLTVTLEWADEDMGRNCGKVVYRRGQEISRHSITGADAVRVWFALNPPSDPKDYGYDRITFECIDEAREE